MIAKPARKGKASDELLRWTLNRAAREFGVHREQLERRRRALSIEPGPDGCFSSQQIAAMMFGDKEAETIGDIAARRRNTELKNEMMAGALIPSTLAAKLAEAYLIPVRQRILSSPLTEAEKAEMLDDLVQFGELDYTQEAIDAYRGTN